MIFHECIWPIGEGNCNLIPSNQDPVGNVGCEPLGLNRANYGNSKFCTSQLKASLYCSVASSSSDKIRVCVVESPTSEFIGRRMVTCEEPYVVRKIPVYDPLYSPPLRPSAPPPLQPTRSHGRTNLGRSRLSRYRGDLLSTRYRPLQAYHAMRSPQVLSRYWLVH